TSYFGREQNTLDPNLKPVQTGELTFGLDHELSGTMSLGVRYTHKWLDRTIEDSGINVPGVGEVFFIANPGFGVAKQILPQPAPAASGSEAPLRRHRTESAKTSHSPLVGQLQLHLEPVVRKLRRSGQFG